MAHRHVKVKLAVARDDPPGPRVGVGPAEGGQAHGRAVVLPVHHVRRREDAPVAHVVGRGVVLVMAGEHIDAVVVQERCRVCRLKGVHDRVVSSGKTNTVKHWAEEKQRLGHGGDAPQHRPTRGGSH